MHVPDEIDAYGALIFAREMGGPAGGESCMHAAKKVELIQSARSDPFRTDPEAHGGGRGHAKLRGSETSSGFVSPRPLTSTATPRVLVVYRANLKISLWFRNLKLLEVNFKLRNYELFPHTLNFKFTRS